MHYAFISTDVKDMRICVFVCACVCAYMCICYAELENLE